MAKSIPQHSLLTPTQKTAFRRAILSWYDKNHRKLPWRAELNHTPDPYYTLVSEAMLQQTQVATVIDYFHRFIKAFPNVRKLAAANEQQVLALWQGLGYYRRARNLHAAAKLIVEEFDASVPSTVSELLKLPGVGRYSSGAIASIAYNQPVPILDGNVTRVLARIAALDQPVEEKQSQASLWDTADHLVQGKRPGDFNQSLMELGALICTPKSPSCLVCPLRKQCLAFKQNKVEQYPMTIKKSKPLGVDHHILAIQREGKFLIQQRPDKGLWSAMWQLPTLELSPEQSKQLKKRAGTVDQDQAELHIQQYSQESLNLTLKNIAYAKTFKHQTTHRTIQFHIWSAEIKKGRLKSNAASWHSLENIKDIPFSNPQHKAIAYLTEVPIT